MRYLGGQLVKSYRSALIAVAIALSACGKNEASGVYVLANDNEVALIQIIEDEGHKLTGRVQTSTIGTGGDVVEKSSNFDGSANGSELLLRPSSIWLGGMQASGTYDRNGINLTGQGFTFTAKRSSLEDYQTAVMHLREVSAKRSVERAVVVEQAQRDDAQTKATEVEARGATKVQNAADNITKLAARLDSGLTRIPDFGKVVTANTARMERTVRASASMSESQRWQLGVQAQQVIVGSNQIEVARNQAAVSADAIIGEVNSLRDGTEKICGVNPSTRLAAPCNAAHSALQAARASSERVNARLEAYESRVQGEIEKQEALAAKIDR